jgi:acyl-homoserine lactone acylase PvdQ
LLKLALVLALVAVIALGGILAWVVVRGFPQREGTAHLSGLSASVKVVRDQNGLVNIYASTPTDLFAAQGWVHASELPFDGHYGDFIGPWLDNLPVHLLWSDSSVDGAARQTLTLNP